MFGCSVEGTSRTLGAAGFLHFLNAFSEYQFMGLFHWVLLVCRFGSSGGAKLAVQGMPFWHFWFCRALALGCEVDLVEV